MRGPERGSHMRASVGVRPVGRGSCRREPAAPARDTQFNSACSLGASNALWDSGSHKGGPWQRVVIDMESKDVDTVTKVIAAGQGGTR